MRDKEKKRKNPRPRPVNEHRFFKETREFFLVILESFKKASQRNVADKF
jgi:hypothetical protein